MRRCCGRFWRKCKPSRFAVSENQPYGRRPVGSPRDGLCPGIGSWGRNVAHECRWEVKCPCASPDFDFRHRIRVGQTALEFIWIRKPLNCVKPTDYRVGVEKCGLGRSLPELRTHLSPQSRKHDLFEIVRHADQGELPGHFLLAPQPESPKSRVLDLPEYRLDDRLATRVERSALRSRHPLVHRPSQRLLPVARDRARRP